jgi:hypothetical protein
VLSAVPVAVVRSGAEVGLSGRRVPRRVAGAAAASGGPGGGRKGGAGGNLGGTLAAVGRGAPVVSPRRK